MLPNAGYRVLRKGNLIVWEIHAINLSSSVAETQAGAPPKVGRASVRPIDLHLQRIVPRLSAWNVEQDVADPMSEAAARATSAVCGEPQVRKVENQIVVAS